MDEEDGVGASSDVEAATVINDASGSGSGGEGEKPQKDQGG